MPILINGTMLRCGMARRDFNSQSGTISNWFHIIKNNKKNTKQTKLPEEITQGASVAVDENGNPIKHLNFNRKPKPTKPASANEIKPNSKQKKLFEE